MAGAVLLVTAPVPLAGQARLSRLDRSDPVYTQHQRLVAAYHEAVARGETPPPLVLFAYRPDDRLDLFDLAARLMLPYAAIATLNGMTSPALPDDTDLLIPSQPGLFAPPGDQGLQRRIAARLAGVDSTTTIRVPGADGTLEAVLFASGLDFTPEERNEFLRLRFSNPLPSAVVSSPFGYRAHPVTGVWSLHAGVDLAADFGTPVSVAADGVVSAIDRDPWLGLSITVTHRGEYETVYAHLQEAVVGVGQTVPDGAILGFVGSTGMSTGAHLHFEIRYRGEARNPEQYVRWQ